MIERKNKPPKQYKCKVCGDYYTKFQSTQQVCSVQCAMALGKKKADEKRKKQATSDRLLKRERLQKLKSRSDWLKDLQKVFNQFIRLRDADLPCISCGRFNVVQWHAGHYRTTKAAPELRFNELNVHKQCSQCNDYLSGNIPMYRPNLIAKIGLDNVEWLERHDHPPLKLTVDEIKDLIRVYKAKVKEWQCGR